MALLKSYYPQGNSISYYEERGDLREGAAVLRSLVGLVQGGDRLDAMGVVAEAQEHTCHP